MHYGDDALLDWVFGEGRFQCTEWHTLEALDQAQAAHGYGKHY